MEASSSEDLRPRLWIDLGLFTLATFALTWLLVGLYIWNAEAMTAMFGPMKLGVPIFYVAVAAPTISALLVTAWRYGVAGLADLGRSLIRVRANWIWIAISLLGYPLLWLAASFLEALATGAERPDLSSWLIALPAVLLAGHLFRDPGALGEELGWRGFALPRLLELMDARKASLLLGLVWAVWHLPAFFLATLSQSQVNFGLFVLNVVAFSVFMTWLFVNMRGSVFWAGIVPHMLINAASKAGITPVFWATVAAAVLIIVFGGKHLQGFGRPKSVLPQSTFLNQAGGAK